MMENNNTAYTGDLIQYICMMLSLISLFGRRYEAVRILMTVEKGRGMLNNDAGIQQKKMDASNGFDGFWKFDGTPMIS